jgi:spore germination protein KC
MLKNSSSTHSLRPTASVVSELWRKKVWIVFLVALLVLFPTASVKPAQAMSKAILLSVGIEKTADGYTVSGAMVTNKFTPEGMAETKVVSADGATVAKAINKIAADQGRGVSLAHCNLIVLGASLATENVATILKYFLEKFEISNNALLVWTDTEVAKMLEISSENRTDAAAGLLETIAAHNKESAFNKPMTLDRFYKDYLKGLEGFISIITLKEDEISNTRQMAVFMSGRFAGVTEL